MLAWQQLETKATIVRDWSAMHHGGVGGQGKSPFCTAAAQAMAGVNLINCFQEVSDECVTNEHLLRTLTLIFVLEQQRGCAVENKFTVNVY